MSTVSKTAWDPALYLEFDEYRARPAQDLLARVNLRIPGAVADIGCGPGNLTKKLKGWWPERAVSGFDSSREMLATACARFGDTDISWHLQDIEGWIPSERYALIFSNAALHWVPDHSALFPRLMHALAPGGVLAVQMPMTGAALYHECLRRVVARPRWQERLKSVRSHDPPLAAASYYDLISPLASRVDIWEAHYHHVLVDKHAVTAWVAGAALVPYLTALESEEKNEFLGDYTDIVAQAYPSRPDGRVLFTMRRIFVIAERRG